MSSEVDFERIFKIKDRLTEKSDVLGGARRNPRVDQDAVIIAKVLENGEYIPTNVFIGIFQEYFETSKDAAKTRVSLALRKLVEEDKIMKVKQGLYMIKNK